MPRHADDGVVKIPNLSKRSGGGVQRIGGAKDFWQEKLEGTLGQEGERCS